MKEALVLLRGPGKDKNVLLFPWSVWQTAE
jgi:hypothetical protein